MKKKICVSFDYENDKNYRNIISAWNENDNIEFSVNDQTPSEISSWDISRIKGVLTTRIKSSDVLLVICGKYINARHRNASEIGEVNWQNWECAQALYYDKKIVIVKLDSNCAAPSSLYFKNKIELVGFEKDKILNAVR